MSDKKNIDIKNKDEKKDIKPVDIKTIQDFYEKYNYPSVDKLFKLLQADGITTITRKEIKDHLDKKVEVQQFKETKTSKLRDGHIVTVAPNTEFQLDIYYMQKYYKKNKNYKYILACIDIFTRKLYCEPLKSKENDEVIRALEVIFKQSKYPFVITSDSDSTFLSNECQHYFKKHDINHNTVPVGDHASLGLIDRVARTLKTILHKRFLIHKTTTWIDVLPTIVEQYNNTPHSAIVDITPNNATTPENISTIIDINNEKRDDVTTYHNEFQPGDKVRIKLTGFNKKTEGQYSDEIFTVARVVGKTVILDNDVIKKYDMLLKVAPDTIETINPIKAAKKEYKKELALKKEEVSETNIVREPRIRKQVDKLKF
jgi:hypothetical protein